MGLLKRFVGWVIETETKRMARKPARKPAPKPRRTKSVQAPPPPPIWLPAGHSVTIQGFDLLDGMVYVGQKAQHPHPSMIDPVLQIDVLSPNAGGAGLERGTAYSSLSPKQRTAYLDWLSTGRRRRDAPIGFALIFFYGLERRVLVDLKVDPGYDAEVDQIRHEAFALLEVYGPNSASFDGYVRAFLDVIDFRRLLVNPNLAFPPPALDVEKRPPPVMLRAELARIAAGNGGLPADRALAWAWYLPNVATRTPAIRSKREFVRLFMIRYMEQYPEGIVIGLSRQHLEVSYRAASSGIGTVTERHPLLSEIFTQPDPVAKLKTLFNQVMEELDPYSRWLGRNPEGASTLAAAAMLPAELLARSTGEIGKLKVWVEARLGTNASAPIASDDLISLWHGSAQAKLSKAESIQVAQLLGRLNAGIEPDVRFGGPPLVAGQAVILFLNESGAPEVSSPEYAAASLLVHLAAAVGMSDGDVTTMEFKQLGAHMETALHLSPAERRRLQAHLQWLVTVDIKLTGLKKRFDAIDASSRGTIGEMLVTIASADGVVSPNEVATLSRIYTLLGLDPVTVTSHLHGALTSPKRGPVVVRAATASVPGVDIPPRPVEPEAPVFSLDAVSIQAKLAETAAVSSLLVGIFIDDAAFAPAATIPAESTADPVATVEGLDNRHARLFHLVVVKEEWNRPDFDSLAEKMSLMPNGAIDTLNEAAYEIAGEPLLDGDDPLVVNTYAKEAMSA